MQDYLSKIKNFPALTIGVLGDIMLDRYIIGKSGRISTEAPVAILNVEEDVCMPGGAANVAANISSLGAKSVLFGIIGQDNPGRELVKEIKNRDINQSFVYTVSGYATIEKTRVVSRGQQIVRYDREKPWVFSLEVERQILRDVAGQIKKWDAIILSDYNKGFFSGKLVKEVVILAKKNKKPIIADIKPANHILFKNVDVITPNHLELLAMTGIENVKKAGIALHAKMNSKILVTRGAQGMILFDDSRNPYSIKARASEVADVVGAGDTVVAALALGVASGLNYKNATILANEAAGIAVSKHGTAVVLPEELSIALRSLN